MSNHNLNSYPIENKFLSSTPKFSLKLQEKDSHNKNDSLSLELPSFEEQKFSTSKKQEPILFNKESKEINDINPFKENFSICSLLNEKNEKNGDENDNNNINNDNIINEKNNEEKDKINIITINMENPNQKKAKNEKVLISFGDKSENENCSLNNNEIIYREKTIDGSIMSNKEKEKEKECMKDVQNKIDIDNINKLVEKKSSSNLQNNNSSFQYSLPLENDMAPNVTDFFIFDEDNHNNSNINDNNEKKDKIENIINNNNNPINNLNSNEKKDIIKRDDNKDNKNNNGINNKYITYSKKKAKRCKTERQSVTYKNLRIEDIYNNKENKKMINSEYKDKKIKNIKNYLIKSCENSKKFKSFIKFCSINISTEEKKDLKNKLMIFEKENTIDNTRSPQKKLTIIKQLKLFNLPKIKENNFIHIKNYSSRENLQKQANNFDLEIKNKNKGRNALNKNIKSEINLNSFHSNHKNVKNLKFNKFQNLFSDFQRYKKVEQKDNTNSINTVREFMNSNNINSNVINNTNSTINANNENSAKYIIKKINNNRIMNNNIRKNIIAKTRNFDNIIFNNSHKMFNQILYNTINYENTEIKTTETINKNINRNKENIKKNVLNKKTNQKAHIKNSLPILQNSIKKINKQNLRNNNDKFNYKFINTKNTNNKGGFQNKIQFKQKKMKNTTDVNSNKINNFIFNNLNKANNKHNHKKFYNKFIYNHFDTNENNNNKEKIGQIIQIKPENTITNENINNIIQNNNFINNNSSSNSLNSKRFNRIKVHILFNKHNKSSTSPLLVSQENNNNNLWKIYKKPKNTCLINQVSNEYNTISGNKNIIKKNIINKNEITEYNSGNRNIKRPKFFPLKKRFISNTNLTERNSTSKFKENDNESLSNKKGSMQELNINKIYKNIKHAPRIDNYKYDIIRYSILRNNLNNQITNEFSITLGEKGIQDMGNNTKNNIPKKKIINIKKKCQDKKIGYNNDKKTIINVNQYYPSYFINSQNQNYKEKK